MENLYNRVSSTPDSFRYRAKFNLKGSSLELFLDTNRKDIVEGLFYSWDGEEETARQFSDFAKEVEGLSFGAFPEASENSFVGLHAPALFYRMFMDQIRRGSPLYPYAKNRDPLNLVCRCFGVYEEDIHELVGNGVEVTTIKDLGDHLQAGVGCGSCHHDLKNILTPLISAPVEIPDEQVPELPLWQKLDSDSLARLAFQELKNLSEASDSFSASLLGTRPGGVLVKLKINNDSDQEAFEAQVSDQLEVALGEGIEIIFQ